MSEPTITQLLDLRERHNNSVKDSYKCDRFGFDNWFYNEANFDEDYIEIPRNQTISGQAIILDW